MRRVIAALIALFVIAAAPAQAANGGASAGSGGTSTTQGSGTGTPSHNSGGTPPTSTGGTTVDPHWVPSAGSGPAPERTPEPRPPSGDGHSQSPTGSADPRDFPPLHLKHQ